MPTGGWGGALMRYLFAVLAVEVRHAAVMVGYWFRPYDMVADRRRWRWQSRALCGYQLGARIKRGVDRG